MIDIDSDFDHLHDNSAWTWTLVLMVGWIWLEVRLGTSWKEHHMEGTSRNIEAMVGTAPMNPHHLLHSSALRDCDLPHLDLDLLDLLNMIMTCLLFVSLLSFLSLTLHLNLHVFR
jgi:hypothetical protein